MADKLPTRPPPAIPPDRVPRPRRPIPRADSSDDPAAARRIDELEAQNAELAGQLTRAARRQQESVSPAPPPSVESVPLPPEKQLQHALGEWIWAHLKRQGIALLLGGGALTWTTIRQPEPAPPSKDVEVYAALREEVIRVNEAQRKQADDLAALRAWLKGYFDATGVKVADPPGAPPPLPVVLAPAPLPRPHKLSRAPDVQVRTPLPAPRPTPEPVRLPASIDALPKVP